MKSKSEDINLREVVDLSLCQHRVVLQLRLSQWWGVAAMNQLALVVPLLLRGLIVDENYGFIRGEGSVRNDDKLGLSGSQRLEGRGVSEGDLSGLHDQSQSGVDRVGGLLCGNLLAGGNCQSRAGKRTGLLWGHRCV